MHDLAGHPISILNLNDYWTLAYTHTPTHRTDYSVMGSIQSRIRFADEDANRTNKKKWIVSNNIVDNTKLNTASRLARIGTPKSCT